MEALQDLARSAFMLGDKDSVPALALEYKITESLLDRVLPKPKPIEIQSSDNHGPVLILDMVGQQAFIPPNLDVIDGEIVGVIQPSDEDEPAELTGEPAGDSSTGLFK